ncbi:MAG TPA: hypothetical protein VHU80_14040 [Polyangiaceae bacterium]|nr:hypothetical protein [Polyangiaceae bacterium]
MHWSLWVSCSMASALTLAGSAASLPPQGVAVLPGEVRAQSVRSSDSPSFDGARVSLRAARGETLALQTRVPGVATPTARLDVPADVATVNAFSVRALHVRSPSTDMYGPSAGRGAYPDVLVPESGDVHTPVAYFDVAVRPDAVPGDHHGSLTVGARTYPVTLRVSRARIDVNREPLVWVFYLPKEVARVHGLADDDGPAELDEERKYVELFRTHGALLASDLPPSRFPPRREFMHDVSFWPVAIDTSSDAAIERDTRAWLALFEGSAVTPFAVPVDEPGDDAARKRARHVADVIGHAGGGRPRLLRAVTDVASPIYGHSMDVFISPKNIPGARDEHAGRGEQFWTYNGKPPEAGSLTLDTESGGLRTWGWIAERYRVPLWYAWEGLYFSDRYNGGGPTDVMTDAVTFDERRRGGTDFGNGDGVLAYPGPLPSLRLKSLRRGLEDRLLLEELRHCGGNAEADRIVRSVVPTALADAKSEPSWPANETTWIHAHDDVLDAIEVHCP